MQETRQITRPGGIVFYSSEDIEALERFYTERIGCSVWLRQEDCIILKFSNMLFGFCRRPKADTCSMITFFYPEKEAVDRMYELFSKEASSPPKENPRYEIYHFFATDPENRSIEFQYFHQQMLPL